MFSKYEKITTKTVYNIIDRKINEFEETKFKLERMNQYKLSDQVNFAILAIEELKEEFERW